MLDIDYMMLYYSVMNAAMAIHILIVNFSVNSLEQFFISGPKCSIMSTTLGAPKLGLELRLPP